MNFFIMHFFNELFLMNSFKETPITTNVVEASDGVIQRKIKSGDRGNVQVNSPIVMIHQISKS